MSEVLAALEAAAPPDLVGGVDLPGDLRTIASAGLGYDLTLPDKAVLRNAAARIEALIALATAQAAQIAGLEDKLAFVQRREIASNTEFDEVWSEAQAEAATLRAEVERLRKALDDEKKMRRSGVRAAFEEGFVRGADDGWLNNPRMEREWRRSSAKMGLKT